MTDAQLWWLTLEFALVAAVVGGGGYLWARYESRRLDRKYGEHRAPGE